MRIEFLGLRFKGSKEFGEAVIIHRSGEQKEFFSRAIKATGGKGAFGDVNTNKDGFHCFFTSFLVVLGVKGTFTGASFDVCHFTF